MPAYINMEKLIEQPVILDWTEADVSLCDCFHGPNNCIANGGLCIGGSCPKMKSEVLSKYFCVREMCKFWQEEFLKLQKVVRAGRYL